MIPPTTSQGPQVLHCRPNMVGSEVENLDGFLETFQSMLDPPSGSGNPWSRMVAQVCCQKIAPV